MKNYCVIFLFLALFAGTFVTGQNPVTTKSIGNKEHMISYPETPTEYNIANYKNIDYLKTNPFQLESAGLHPEIYISNTHRGVIIITTSESNDALKDFKKNLELNPNYYESITRQDTIIFTSVNKHYPAFDYTKASSINQNYKNAFNFTTDPRTGVSWSKGTHKDFLQDDVLGKVVYDLIIVISNSSLKK